MALWRMYSSRGPHESRQRLFNDEITDDATRCRWSGATFRKRFTPDRELEVGGIEEDDVVDPVGWDEVEERLGQIAVRVDQREAAPVRDVLDRHVLQQRRLARSGLPEDRDMMPTVRRLDAEYLLLPAVRGPSQVRDGLWICVASHTSPDSEPRAERLRRGARRFGFAVSP